MDKIKGRMFYIAFVASLGGLLFGFDTAVISGAEKAIQQAFSLTPFWHGFTIAAALIGTIIGAFFCDRPSEKYGRKRLLIIIAVLYFISAFGNATVRDWYFFIFFRLLGGLAVGASSVVGPIYIAEISPSKWRGRFVAFFQFNIVLGIVVAYFTNYAVVGHHLWFMEDWQLMLGIEAIPAILFAALLFTVPESPRWLIKVGRTDEGCAVLAQTGGQDLEVAVSEIKVSLAESAPSGEKLFQKRYSIPILIAFLVATLNQLTGINAILYYAPRILETSGVFHEGAMLQSTIVGLTNLTFTMLGMFLIDKVGRKKLLIVGSVGMAISLALVARGFFLDQFQGYYMLLCIMGYIAFFAISLGATIWVLISEVFPNSVREKGQKFGSMTHWTWDALLTWFFPLFLSIGGGYIFSFFAIIALLSIVFALWIPETKGKSLEQIQNELTN